MWTLVTAVNLVNQLKEKVEAQGFSIGLTGGCIFRGYSNKDADLCLYPMMDDADYNNVLVVIKDELKPASFVAVDHGNAKLVYSLKLQSGKRVDLFVFQPGLGFSSRTDPLPVAGTKLGYA